VKYTASDITNTTAAIAAFKRWKLLLL
jgi:hypothetical protein